MKTRDFIDKTKACYYNGLHAYESLNMEYIINGERFSLGEFITIAEKCKLIIDNVELKTDDFGEKYAVFHITTTD